MLQRQHSFLIDRLDCEHTDLLYKLVELDLLTDRQIATIKHLKNTFYDTNEELLSILQRRDNGHGLSLEVEDKFIEALKDCDQGHLGEYLHRCRRLNGISPFPAIEPERLFDCDPQFDQLPLNDNHYKSIGRNSRHIKNIIVVNDKFLDYLVTRCCITVQQRQAVARYDSREDKCFKLLEFIKRGSRGKVREFFAALEAHGNTEASQVIKDCCGFFVSVHVNIVTQPPVASDELSSRERQIAADITDRLKSPCQTPEEVRAIRELFSSWVHTSEEQFDERLQLFAVTPGECLIFNFYCPSVRVLRRVIQVYDMDLVKPALTNFVSMMVSAGVCVGFVVDSVWIEPVDLTELYEYLDKNSDEEDHPASIIKRRRTSSGSLPGSFLAGGSIDAIMEEDEPQRKKSGIMSTSAETRKIPELNVLPWSPLADILADIDLILKKTAVNLTKLFGQSNPCPLQQVYKTLSAVGGAPWIATSSEPCGVLIEPNFVRDRLNDPHLAKQLRRALNGAFRSCKPRGVTKEEAVVIPNTKGGVKGIAVLGDSLYVVGDKSEWLNRFNRKPPFQHHDAFKVPGLSFPCDLISDETLNRLYVADSNNDCIWMVEMENGLPKRSVEELEVGKPAYKKITGVEWPAQIYITRIRTIITIDDLLRIKEFDLNGGLLREHQLPNTIAKPWHLFEHPCADTNNLILCCGETNTPFHGIVEILRDSKGTFTGTPIVRYGGAAGSDPRELNTPRYFARGRDSEGVFVCDRKNYKVVFIRVGETSGESWQRGWSRVVVTEEVGGPRRPFRLCFDDSEGRLFVGDQYQHVVCVFKAAHPSHS